MAYKNLFRQAQIFISIPLLICLFIPELHAQRDHKIQIVLLGTFHLTPSKTDVYSNTKIDLHSPVKQKEIQEVVNKIVAFGPNAVCLEYPMEEQPQMDSIYNAYKMGSYKLADNERDLFGFQAVRKLGIKSPTCINYSFGKFPTDTVSNFAGQNGQMSVLDSLQTSAAGFMKEVDEKLTKLSLRDFLIYCNTKKALQMNLGLYTKYFTKIGKGKNYVGADLVAEWYSTNIHIYTNILRIIKPADKRIIVLFGQGHIPILKHLFSNNSDFEVIEAADMLK